MYKRQPLSDSVALGVGPRPGQGRRRRRVAPLTRAWKSRCCLLYTSDAADERSSVDLGGRRIIKKKNTDGGRGDMSDHNRHQNEALDIR